MALSLPFGAAQAPPSVRIPVLEGNFGSLDAEALAERLTGLSVHLRAVPGASAVELSLPAGEGSADVAPGDAVSLSLGFEDAGATALFKGEVEGVHVSLTGALRIVATDGGAKLAALRLERSYESVSAGDVVQDLLAETGVPAGAVEAGPSLPFYAVGRNRSGLAWVDTLARASAFLAFFDGEGSLHFGPPSSGAAAAAFVYGQDVLFLSSLNARPLASGATVVGEGAAGSEGQEAWAWLLKDPSAVSGEAGEDPARRVLSRPALRTREGADTAARGWVEGAARAAKGGELVVAGTPQALPGATVDVAGTPGGSLDGSYLVLAAHHRFGARGWTTALRVASLGGGAGGLLGGLL